MAKKARELSSFGLAGLLEAKSHIEYCSLPSTLSLGRVSDLLVAQLKKSGPEELRLRAILLFSIFEACQLLPKTQILHVECGMDAEDLGIGVTFQTEALNEVEPRLSKLIELLKPYANRIIIRSQKSKSRFEMVSLFSHKGAETQSSARIERVDLDLGLKETPSAESYTELGDLNYKNLLEESGDRKISSDAPVLDEKIVVKGSGGDLVDQSVFRIRNMVSKIFNPFKKPEKENGPATSEHESPESPESPESNEKSFEKAAPAPHDAKESSEGELGGFVEEIENGDFSQALLKAQSELEAIKKELANQRAKRWADGLLGELLKEKSKLVERARWLNQAVRQREMEFKNKESTLQQELVRLGEESRKRELLLSRTKDQLADAQLGLEKLKSLGENASEEAKFKQKHGASQRLLAAAKKENQELKDKLDDLNKKLTQMQLTKRPPNANGEMLILQQKYDRLSKQTEEFKRTNQNLLAKLNERKERVVSEGNAEQTKRLEAAMKLAVNNKREAEAMRSEVLKLTQELAELRKKPDAA